MKTKHQQPIAHQARMRHRDARAVVATRFVRGILKNKTQETGRGVLGHVFWMRVRKRRVRMTLFLQLSSLFRPSFAYYSPGFGSAVSASRAARWLQ